MGSNSSKPSRLKKVILGALTVGLIGSALGFLAGLTLEGALGGFMLGWVLGEILGASVSD